MPCLSVLEQWGAVDCDDPASWVGFHCRGIGGQIMFPSLSSRLRGSSGPQRGCFAGEVQAAEAKAAERVRQQQTELQQKLLVFATLKRPSLPERLSCDYISTNIFFCHTRTPPRKPFKSLAGRKQFPKIDAQALP